MAITHYIAPKHAGTVRVIGTSGFATEMAKTVADYVQYFEYPYTGFLGGASQGLYQVLLRLDLRRYKGAKANSVQVNMRHRSTSLTTGAATSDLELRTHTRVNSNGLVVVEDYYHYTDVALETLYATKTGFADSGGISVFDYAFTNNGNLLLNAINAALESDGIMDMMLCLDNYTTNNPPADTDSEYTVFYGPEQLHNECFPNFQIEFDANGEYFLPTVDGFSGDIFRTYVTASSWNDVLVGLSPILDSVANDNSESIFMNNDGAGNYIGGQLLFRADLSGIDTEKPIKRAYISLLYSGIPASNTDSWQIRRWDFTGVPASSMYRTAAQLSLLTLVGEFTIDDMLAADVTPERNDDAVVTEFHIDGGQELIDICLEASATTGFVLHNERYVTGTAPLPAESIALSVAMIGELTAKNNATQIVVEYDDGSAFIGSVF